jgi:hypothetical protein
VIIRRAIPDNIDLPSRNDESDGQAPVRAPTDADAGHQPGTSELRFDALYDVASYAPVLYVADGAPGVGVAVTWSGRDRYLIEVVAPGVEVRSIEMRHPTTLAARAAARRMAAGR